ncbi:translation initiation factor IF-2 N-terminal domain-containing protein [Saccharopolyspora sp. NFXS83]|uniref:translation initiation factor IF-2 N-terminal domain-containing protein n=1 Tax=Saccharopolyspora sp. NFXS83 TaxID=2993560 RepID=UPI00224B2096|nr:translation initiation factor IF-2 N-terminal domain-containing protein [Saccharopolyspora sp. NFXS83]MCX2731662.1 translation initiation factor IF-2 N-terminal domain-containing protein [Saccharopolyspora sp. NFXS83]
MSNRETPAGNTSGPSSTSTQESGSGTFELPAKLRVHALAKLLGASSREVITTLDALGEPVRSAQSNITREVALQVVQDLRPEQIADGEPADSDAAMPQAEQSGRADQQETAAAEPAAEPERQEGAEAAGLNPVFAAPQAMFLAPEPVAARPAPAAAKPAVEQPAEAPVEQHDADSETADVDESADADTDGDDDDQGGRRRRRRGRRGRGRGKGGDGDQSDSGEEQDDEGGRDNADKQGKQDKPAKQSRKEARKEAGRKGSGDDSAETTDGNQDAKPADAPAGDSDGDSGDDGNRRRRRRRRRKGSGDDDGQNRDDDPPNTVVHVREERQDNGRQESSDDEVRAIKGSTRLEAKRQRRRDGREAGRRRAPVLSESEFLARRESVDRRMVVRENGDQTQIAVLEDNVLVENFVTASGSGSLVGNVYLGRVQNVLPSMEAAFVDIGRGRNAVLYAGEVDWDAAGLAGKARRIEQALSTGDSVLVQVTKDPVGHKGARLTTQISLPGRFLVYVPGGGATGISRKLPDNERKRLKEILKRIVPDNAGVIIRTASEGTSEEALDRDVRRLQAQWEIIKEKADTPKAQAPQLLYEEPDLLIKVVRDLFTEDFSSLVVQGGDAWDTIEAYVQHVAPDLMSRLTRHVGKNDVFTEQRISEQIAKALDRKVWLPSGGYLVIDRTEAMTVIDVNTGKFTGSGGNLEETVTRNNLEAAEEIVRQLRLRDIGGIIVIDFIDMVLESNRDLVLRRLTECLGRDRTRHQVAEVTSLGLVQMTRKRVGTGLLEAYSSTCEHCRGRGLLVSTDPAVHQHAQGGGNSGSGNGGGGGGSRRNRNRGKQETPESDGSQHAERNGVVQDQAAKDSQAGKQDSEKSDSGKQESGKQDSGKQESGKQESGKQESGKQDSGKQDSGKQESGKQDSDKRGSGKQEREAQPSVPAAASADRTAEPQQPAPAKPESTPAPQSAPARPAALAEPESAATGETNGRSRRRKVSRPAGSAGTPVEPVVMTVAEKPSEPATNGVPEVPAPATASVARRPRRRAASRPAGPPPDDAVPGNAEDATAGANSES